VLCKQFKIKNGNIMERFKELLEKHWRNPRDDPRLMNKPQKSYHDLKEIDTIPDVSFVSSVLVRSTIVNGSLGLNMSG